MERASAVTIRWQRLTALFCVAAFLGSASGVLPAFVAFAGQFDDDHYVLISSSAEKVQIRFHHAHEEAPEANAPGELMIDESRSDSSADHVIEFVSAGDSLRQLPSAAALDHGLQPFGAVESAQVVPIARPFVAAPHARPPPGEATWSRCLRSVVLLV